MHLITIDQVIAQYNSEPTTPKESVQKSVKGHENEYSNNKATKTISYRPAWQDIVQYHTRIACQLTVALTQFLWTAELSCSTIDK